MSEPDDGEQSETEAAGPDAQRRMAKLRQVLSQAELEVVLLYSVEGLSPREIAQVVRRSERVVHTLLQQAKRKAREALRPDARRQRQ